MHPAQVASNMNFPAPLAVLGFLAAGGGLFLAAATLLVCWFSRKLKFASIVGMVVGAGAVIYFALLFGLSASSRATTLARGQEKYFCEIDCHLAYSVVDVKSQALDSSMRYIVSLRTRFDETTTSPSRPKDALLTPLRPTDAYITQLEFTVPANSGQLALLVATSPQWPDYFVIGDENSLAHKKTYLGL